MNFNDIKFKDYVRFNRRIKYLYFKLDEDFKWIDEPTCNLEVSNISQEEETMTLECLHGCGNHSKLEFTKEEYETLVQQLGEHLLIYVHVYQAYERNPTIPPVVPYVLTIGDNIDYIDKILEKKVAG